MNRIQKNIIKLLRGMRLFHHRRKPELEKVAALLPLFELLFVKEELLETLRIEQEVDITGLSDKKAELRSQAIQKGVVVQTALESYSSLCNLPILFKEIHYTPSDLKRMGDSDLVIVLKLIARKATEYIAQLPDYGMSEELLEQLEDATNLFNASVNTPKDGILTHKQITDKIGEEVKISMATVKKIDLLMKIFSQTNPPLYSEYLGVRRLETHSGSIDARVQVNDAQTKEGLAGSRVVITLNDTTVIDKLTAAGGGINIKSMDEDSYMVTISKPNYQTCTVPFVVSGDDGALLTVDLRKIE